MVAGRAGRPWLAAVGITRMTAARSEIAPYLLGLMVAGRAGRPWLAAGGYHTDDHGALGDRALPIWD